MNPLTDFDIGLLSTPSLELPKVYDLFTMVVVDFPHICTLIALSVHSACSLLLPLRFMVSDMSFAWTSWSIADSCLFAVIAALERVSGSWGLHLRFRRER
jgi:hypothetical protein